MRDKKDQLGSALRAFYIHGRYSAQVPIGGRPDVRAGDAIPPLGEFVSSEAVPQIDINSFSCALNLSVPWERQQRR